MLGWLRARRASRLARSGQQSQACPHPFEEGRELLEAIASLHAANHQVGLQSWRGLASESKRVFQEVEMFFARAGAREGSVCSKVRNLARASGVTRGPIRTSNRLAGSSWRLGSSVANCRNPSDPNNRSSTARYSAFES